jgi:hypothetical protein
VQSRFLIAAAAVVAMFVLAGSGNALAEAQQENPLFVQARTIADQVASSAASAEQKASFADRFAALQAEQQNLWQLAGQVDSGQCVEDCQNDYNNRVVAWQNDLVSFSAEASAAMPQGSAQVTLENHTGQTLDLVIDQQQQCQALMNLMCTAQTSSGFHVLVATAGGQPVGSEPVTLKQGESYTFAVR